LKIFAAQLVHHGPVTYEAVVEESDHTACLEDEEEECTFDSLVETGLDAIADFHHLNTDAKVDPS
jgi:hypothetical protein